MGCKISNRNGVWAPSRVMFYFTGPYGNPGVAQFYRPFLICLRDRIGHFANIHSISHAGHTLFYPTVQCYNLETQVQHKLFFLDYLHTVHEANGQPLQFFLIGHSIGSYICLEMMRQRPDLAIRHTMAAFPFVQFDLSRWQTFGFQAMFFASPLIVQFMRLLCLLPLRTRKTLIWLLSAVPAEHHDTAAQVLQPRLVENIMFLANDEFQCLPRSPVTSRGRFNDTEDAYLQDSNLDLESGIAERVSWLWCPNDRWAPMRQYQRLKQRLLRMDRGDFVETEPTKDLFQDVGRNNARISSSVFSLPLLHSQRLFLLDDRHTSARLPVTHAFCVEAHSSALVATLCADRVALLCDDISVMSTQPSTCVNDNVRMASLIPPSDKLSSRL